MAFWALNFPDDGWRVLTASPDGGLVTAAKGLRLGADTSWQELPALDVLLHPGGHGTRALLAELDPTIEVRPDARLAGAERAREVRRGIQYDPAPPV